MRFELTRVTPIDFESIALTARPSCHHNPNHTHRQNTNTTHINTPTQTNNRTPHHHAQHTTHTHNRRARETLPATSQTLVLTPPVSRQPQRTLKTKRRPSEVEWSGVVWSGVWGGVVGWGTITTPPQQTHTHHRGWTPAVRIG